MWQDLWRRLAARTSVLGTNHYFREFALFLAGWLCWLQHRLGFRTEARRRRGIPPWHFAPRLLLLEARCLMSAALQPIPEAQLKANAKTQLSEIFWNGGAPLDKAMGVNGVPSPDAAKAGKTITLTNYGKDTIYPFLRTSNSGRDPNDSKNRYYDPQDLHTIKDQPGYEFREYVGYTLNGKKYLGLPSGASVTFEVPLVLWDGNNISIVTDGKYLTTPKGQPGSTLFGYDTKAKIVVAEPGQSLSNSIWMQKSANFPSGESPLVMFYFTPQAATVADDAPSQPAELTFRDSYLKNFIDDPKQTFPLMNYDVTNVNKLQAPGSMEASDVPITSGSVAGKNLFYYGKEAFGWHGSNKNTVTFAPPLKDFVKQTGSSLGMYFGGKGWPTFYNPNKDEIGIPSGANVFDLSPLDVNGKVVHASNYNNNRWILSSSGSGAIMASAGGPALTDPKATKIPLDSAADPKVQQEFVDSMTSMEASGEPVYLSISNKEPPFKPYQGVLGTLVHYDPSGSVRAYRFVSGGSGYSDMAKLKVVSVNGHGAGATGDLHIQKGVIVSIGLDPTRGQGGSGYTAPPKVEIIDPNHHGTDAQYIADITGGTATVKLAEGRTLPTVSVSWVFSRRATDYAATRITDVWYSWAKYYSDQFKTTTPPKPVEGKLVFLNPDGKPGTLLSNEIEVTKGVPSTLAVGMTVTGAQPGSIPAGTTVLKIDSKKNIIYLSQIPDAKTPKAQQYTFGNPKELPIDTLSALYTKTFDLTFSGPAAQAKAKQFAGSVYESMQAQSVALPPSPYLPTTMNLVAHVIKFYANLPGFDKSWGPNLVGEIRDFAKSILRGVYDYFALPNQKDWYPDPANPAGTGAKINGTDAAYNVYNLDPYVWFVHKVEGLDGYAFSIDDDVANPAAGGPEGDTSKYLPPAAVHLPSNLQIAFAGITGAGNPPPVSNAPPLLNQKEWFPTTPWGSIKTTATIGVWNGPGYPEYKGDSLITLTGDPTHKTPQDIKKLFWQINNPGPGQLGAFISAPGYIPPETMVIFKGPAGVDKPQFILSTKSAKSTGTKSVDITIDAAQP